MKLWGRPLLPQVHGHAPCPRMSALSAWLCLPCLHEFGLHVTHMMRVCVPCPKKFTLW